MANGRERWWVWVAFAGLCLLAGSRWILADNWPQMGSTLRSEAWACGLGAVGSGALALMRRRRFPGPGSFAELMLLGVGLLAAPALGAALRGPAGESLNRTIALALVPVVAVVLSGRSRLWPGLAGLAGALLVLPFTALSGWLGYVGLAMVPLLVGAACAVPVQEVAREWAAAAVFAGGAVGLVGLEVGRVVTGGMEAQRFSSGAVGMDVLEAALVVAVVLRAGGVRYAARYFVVLLVMLLEGVVLLRAGMTLRMGIGMGLLAVGAGALVRESGTERGTPGLHLR